MNEAKGAKPEVPAGLTRCPKCGHFKGRCVQNGQPWTITCNCNPNICSRCNTPVHEHRIGTNEYDERDGRCYHVGFVCALMHRCPNGYPERLSRTA